MINLVKRSDLHETNLWKLKLAKIKDWSETSDTRPDHDEPAQFIIKKCYLRETVQ